MQAGQVHRLLDVEQGVAVGAHAVELVPDGVAGAAPAVIVQGGANPIHVGVAGIEHIHILLVSAAVVGGEDQRCAGGAGMGNVGDVAVGGDVVGRAGHGGPHVHLAADADKHRAAQGIQIAESLIELGIVGAVGNLEAVGGFVVKVEIDQKGPVPLLKGGTKDIGPILQRIAVGQAIVEGDDRLPGHLALVGQAVAAVGQGAALGGAAVEHAAVRLVLGAEIAVVGARRLGDRVDLRAGVQVLVSGFTGGGALVGQGGDGQPQAHCQGQRQR